MQKIDDIKVERLVLTVEEAGEMLGISRATAYMLANTGRLPSIRISERRIIVPRRAIDELLAAASSNRVETPKAAFDRMPVEAGENGDQS